MKKIAVIGGICMSSLFTGAQSNWAPVDMPMEGWSIRVMYEDTVEDCLWVGGHIWDNDVDQNEYLMKYDGTQWTAYGPFDGQCFAIIRYNSQLIIGGGFDEYQGNYCSRLAVWEGNTFVPLAEDVMNSTQTGYGTIWVLEEIEDELYIGGAFGIIQNTTVRSLAKIQSGVIEVVDNFQPLSDFVSIHAIKHFQNELYVGGNFAYGDQSLRDVVLNSEGTWQGVNDGLLGGNDEVSGMEVFQNELYVAGSIYLNAGNAGSFIQKWNGEEWSGVGGGLRGSDGTYSSNGQVNEVLIHDNKLYIGGVFDYAGDIEAHRICYWDGEKYCALGGEFTNNVSALAFFQDTLYIGTSINCEIDGLVGNGVWKFTAGDYVEACSTVGINEQVSEIQDLQLFPNPATSSISISSRKEIKWVCLFDVTGNRALEKSVSGKSASVEVSGLSKGLYLLQVVLADGSVVLEKVVVE